MEQHRLLEEQLEEFVDKLLKALPEGKFPRKEIAAQWAREIEVAAKEGESEQRLTHGSAIFLRKLSSDCEK